MTLSREVVVPGMLAEYASFADLVREIPESHWESPSRCEGWRVADVASHVVGQLADVVNLRLDGLGSPEVTERQVNERRGRGSAELADELESSIKTAGDLAAAFDDATWEAQAPGGTASTLGFGIESLWFDTFLHADDIRSALGQSTHSGEGLVASLSHIAQVLTDQGWGPAELSFGTLGRFDVSGGGGEIISGDPMTFVLAATGRGDLGAFDQSVNIYR